MSTEDRISFSDGVQMPHGAEGVYVDGIESSPNASWRSLFNFTSQKHTPTIAIALMLTIAVGLIIPAFAIFLGNLFDSFTSFGSGSMSGSQLLSKVSRDALILLWLGGASWILHGSFFFSWVIFAELQARGARKQLFCKLLSHDIRWFDTRKRGIGAFLSHAQKQIRELQIATSQPLGFTVQYFVRTVAALGLALYTSWKITLVTMAAVPFSSALISYLSSKMNPIIKAQQSELNDASRLSYDAFTAMEVVKCFNGQSKTYWQFISCIREAARCYMKLSLLTSFQMGIVRFMTFGMFVQGFWYGSSLVGSGELSSGDVLRAFWACLIAIQSIEQTVNHIPALVRGKIAGATLKSYLEDSLPRETMATSRGTFYPNSCKGDIELKDVSFAYPFEARMPALKSTNMVFPAGKTTFIIGRSGSGKTTLANLLLKFYPPCSGEILIDGSPIQAIDTLWIRKNITFVQQQSFLFNETLSRNIIFGSSHRNDITAQNINSCIEIASLQNVINQLPKELETVVGVGGNLLSGGQKQRVAIARARLRDSPILILDECTSALDYQNRVAVMNAIRVWRKEKTTIIITHDTTQIAETDFAYVLDRGSMVDSGYKRDLIDKTIESTSEDRDNLSNAESGASRSLGTSSMECFLRLSDANSDASLYSSIEDKSITIPFQRLSTEKCFISSQNSERNTNNSKHSWPPAMISPKTQKPIVARRISTPKQPETLTVDTHIDQNFLDPSPRSSSSWASEHLLSPKRGRKVVMQNLCSETEERPISSLYRIFLAIPSVMSLKQRALLTLALVCAAMHASSTPIFSYLLSQLFQAFYATNSSKLAMKWSLAVLGLAVGDALISFVMHYLLEYCSQVWMDLLRHEAIRRTLDQPQSWFEKEENNPLHLTICLDQNAEDIRNLVGKFGGFVLVAGATMVIAIVWSFLLCWKLTLVGIACGPFLYAITKGLETVNREWESRSNEINETVASIFSETFTDIRTVRAFTLEPYFLSKHSLTSRKAMTTALKRAGYSGIFFGLAESAVIFASALIFYYGAVVTSSGEFSVTDVISVFAMILFSIGYANTVVSWIPQVNSAYDAATRLLRLSHLPFESSHEHTGKLRVFEPVPITFSHLNFRYPQRSDAVVLRDLSLSIPANSCSALVGSSGSGKSTIASLLLGLYPPSNPGSGRPPITLGGVDIRLLHVPTLRSFIAFVPQQPRLFGDTIKANITYGLDPYSCLNLMKNVRAAAQAAGIDEFINSLPEGYSTLVGDGGLGLSGGQAQRLVIARALVRQPRVLILDEATSNLDGESAKVIRQSVQKLVTARQGMTVILITHAREMMEIADNVIVIDEGSVIEQGPYDTLLRRPGSKLREGFVGKMYESG